MFTLFGNLLENSAGYIFKMGKKGFSWMRFRQKEKINK